MNRDRARLEICCNCLRGNSSCAGLNRAYKVSWFVGDFGGAWLRKEQVESSAAVDPSPAPEGARTRARAFCLQHLTISLSSIPAQFSVSPPFSSQLLPHVIHCARCVALGTDTEQLCRYLDDPASPQPYYTASLRPTQTRLTSTPSAAYCVALASNGISTNVSVEPLNARFAASLAVSCPHLSHGGSTLYRRERRCSSCRQAERTISDRWSVSDSDAATDPIQREACAASRSQDRRAQRAPVIPQSPYSHTTSRST